jgi:hypothetical protein
MKIEKSSLNEGLKGCDLKGCDLKRWEFEVMRMMRLKTNEVEK